MRPSRPRHVRAPSGAPRVPALLALAAALLAAPAAGQAVDAELRRTVGALADSATVRVIAPGVYVDPGLFLGVQNDSLLLADADARLAVAFDELEELAVRKSQWLTVSATTAGVAAVFGIAIGYFVGTGECDFQLAGCGRYQLEGSARWGGVFALAGGVVGAVVGSRRTTWRRVFP